MHNNMCLMRNGGRDTLRGGYDRDLKHSTLVLLKSAQYAIPAIST